MKFLDIFLSEVITDFRTAGHAKDLVGHAQIGPHKVTLAFTPYGSGHYSANYTVNNSISKKRHTDPRYNAAIAHTIARSVDHFVATHKPSSISMQSYDDDEGLEAEKNKKYHKMANYLAVKHGGVVDTLQDRHFDSPKHIVRFPGNVNESVDLTTMPHQILHADTHAAVAKVGYEPNHRASTEIHREWKHNWRLEPDPFRDIEPHLEPIGWKKISRNNDYNNHYLHPNGCYLKHTGSTIEMTANFHRGDR